MRLSANLWLRTADRVKLNREIKATSFDELFEKTKALNWENYIPEDAEFPVWEIFEIKSFRSDCQAIVKKAVVEKLKYKTFGLRKMDRFLLKLQC